MKSLVRVMNRRIVWLVAGVLVVWVGFSEWSPVGSRWNAGGVWADTRQSPPREAFLSGGERSEAVLREILATLKQIDGRLERFERALREAEQQAARTEPPPRGAADASPARPEQE